MGEPTQSPPGLAVLHHDRHIDDAGAGPHGVNVERRLQPET